MSDKEYKQLFEQKVLKISIIVTIILALTGVFFGLLSGSLAIVFDGMFDMVDAAMSILSFLVARLLTSEGNQRFQYGYWHIEPMVIFFNGGILILLCAYAFINAIGSLLAGGRELNFSLALIFAALMSVLSMAMFVYVKHKNIKIKSEFLRLDTQSWFISSLISAALVAAFCIGTLIEGTRYHNLTPYIDPLIVAILTFCLIFVPIPVIRDAMCDMFIIAPFDLDKRVREFLDELTVRNGFKTYTSYVAKVGRAQFIEIHIVVPLDYIISCVGTLDAIRHEIGAAIGGEGPQRWLTIAFTTEEHWI